MAPTDSVDRIDPTEPALAIEPIDPTQRIEPAEPMLRIDPFDAIDRMEPVEPIERIDAALRRERQDPAEPAARHRVPHGVASVMRLMPSKVTRSESHSKGLNGCEPLSVRSLPSSSVGSW